MESACSSEAMVTNNTMWCQNPSVRLTGLILRTPATGIIFDSLGKPPTRYMVHNAEDHTVDLHHSENLRYQYVKKKNVNKVQNNGNSTLLNVSITWVKDKCVFHTQAA
jgi:hypothetical protein